MRRAVKAGFSFGLTSGVITTLGLMVGLYSGTESKLVVIGGILMIAVADAFSDALGIHVSQEYQAKYEDKEVWMATLMTFIVKFVFSLSFVIPILVWDLARAILVGVVWGLLVLSGFSYRMAKEQGEKAGRVVMEHLVIGVVVILVTQFLGRWVGVRFSG